MRIRAVLVRLHRYAGLATALFLVVAGLTGSVIAFSGELDAWLNPKLYRAQSQGTPLGPDELARRIERALPDAYVSYIARDNAPGETVLVNVEGRGGKELGYGQVFTDPVTGHIQGTREWGACCFSREHVIPFLYLTHYSLSVPGTWGVLVMGVVSLVWMLDCFVGFALTLPRAGPWMVKWKPSWLVKPGASAHRFTVDIHRAAGLWLWLALFAVAMSGVALNLPDQVFRPMVSAFSPLKPSALQIAARRQRTHPLPASLSFADAVIAAQRHMGRTLPVFGLLHYPEYGAYGVGLREANLDGRDGLGANWIYLDDRTGRILTADIIGQGSAGDVFLQWQFPLHSGRIIGLPGRILIAICGLAVAMLSVTGILIWLKKHRAAKLHRRRAVSRPQAGNGNTGIWTLSN